MTLILGSLQLGLLYGMLALGVYISFRILNLPDLTAEGSFTLGLAISATLTTLGHPMLALVCALLAGALAGCATGLLQTKLGIHPILSGILVMSALYSVNLFALGNRSNLSLIGAQTLFDSMQGIIRDKETAKLVLTLAACAAAFGGLAWFFQTLQGLRVRAVGSNEGMVRASSIPADGVKILGLAVSNACIALSGAVLAQYQGYADIGSGVGMVVVGLASVIIGEAILGRRSVTMGLLGAVLGSIAYRFIIALALKTSIFPAYAFKLVSAAIVVAALSAGTIKQKLRLMRLGKAAEHAGVK